MRTSRLTAAAMLALLPALLGAKPATPPGGGGGGPRPQASIQLDTNRVEVGDEVVVRLGILDRPNGSPLTVGTLDATLRRLGGGHHDPVPLDGGGAPDSAGQRTITFRPSEEGHFHVQGRYFDADNRLVDETPPVNLWVSVSCARSNEQDLRISQTGAAGTARPAPGTTSTWSYTVTVENCTGEDIPNSIKVQGGSNGWAGIFGTPTSTDPGSTIVVHDKSKSSTVNRTITWTLPRLAAGGRHAITVQVSGPVPSGACWDGTSSYEVADGAVPAFVRFLSGQWSAAYLDAGGAAHKPYTDGAAWRSYLVVAC